MGPDFTGIHENFLITSFDIPAVNGDGKFPPVVELIGHHAFVKDLGSHDDGVDFVYHSHLFYLSRNGLFSRFGFFGAPLKEQD